LQDLLSLGDALLNGFILTRLEIRELHPRRRWLPAILAGLCPGLCR
jgi:hypothetical protein